MSDRLAFELGQVVAELKRWEEWAIREQRAQRAHPEESIAGKSEAVIRLRSEGTSYALHEVIKRLSALVPCEHDWRPCSDGSVCARCHASDR